MHLYAPITLPLNLPENPTIADVIHVLQKCDPTKRVYDEVYRPLTAIVLDSQGDAVFSALPRVSCVVSRAAVALEGRQATNEWRDCGGEGDCATTNQREAVDNEASATVD